MADFRLFVTAPNAASKVTLTYDLATDAGFTQIIKTEMLDASANDDYTVSVDISGLKSNTKYYYRFAITNTNIVSPTGETKTLAKAGEMDEVKLAALLLDKTLGLLSISLLLRKVDDGRLGSLHGVERLGSESVMMNGPGLARIPGNVEKCSRTAKWPFPG